MFDAMELDFDLDLADCTQWQGGESENPWFSLEECREAAKVEWQEPSVVRSLWGM